MQLPLLLATDADLVRTKLFLRGKTGVEALWGLGRETTAVEPDASLGVPRADIMEFSVDGAKLALVDSQTGFSVRATEDSAELLTVANPGIHALAWSPLGTHVLTWQRPVKDSDRGNLVVWNAVSGAEVARFNQKTYSRDVSPRSWWYGWVYGYVWLTCESATYVLCTELAVDPVVVGRDDLCAAECERRRALQWTERERWQHRPDQPPSASQSLFREAIHS